MLRYDGSQLSVACHARGDSWHAFMTLLVPVLIVFLRSVNYQILETPKESGYRELKTNVNQKLLQLSCLFILLEFHTQRDLLDVATVVKIPVHDELHLI